MPKHKQPYRAINVHLRGEALELYEQTPEGTRAEMINRAIVALLDPEHRKRMMAILSQLLAEMELEDSESFRR